MRESRLSIPYSSSQDLFWSKVSESLSIHDHFVSTCGLDECWGEYPVSHLHKVHQCQSGATHEKLMGTADCGNFTAQPKKKKKKKNRKKATEEAIKSSQTIRVKLHWSVHAGKVLHWRSAMSLCSISQGGNKIFSRLLTWLEGWGREVTWGQGFWPNGLCGIWGAGNEASALLSLLLRTTTQQGLFSRPTTGHTLSLNTKWFSVLHHKIYAKNTRNSYFHPQSGKVCKAAENPWCTGSNWAGSDLLELTKICY